VLAKAGGGCFGIRRLLLRLTPDLNGQVRLNADFSEKNVRVPVAGSDIGRFRRLVVRGYRWQGFNGEFGEGAMIAFIFGVVVSAVAGPVDGYFAHVLPIPLRVPLTAIVGATIAVGLFLYLVGKGMSLQFPTPIAIIGALSMGMCSLLSHDYRT
jgi:hypothetical protein